MKYLSLCSGIDAVSVAWRKLRWEAFGFSEIEPFPSAVLAHHWPDVPNLGDMTKFAEWRNLHEVDLLVGGTPCQAFSVAGLRNSLDDARGNLTLTYVSILNKIDHERSIQLLQPAICVWENVPGVLNTKDNAFGCFLAALAGEDVPLVPSGGRWTNAGYVRGPQRTIAWRVIDAQHFGVAQRRRRVFVVASAREGFCPEQILFEFEGVRRDSPPSREAGQGATSNVRDSTEEPIFLDRASFNQGENAQYQAVIRQNGLADALVAKGPHAVCAKNGTHVTAFPLDSQNWGEGHNSGGKGFGEVNDPSFTLTKGHHHGVATCIGIDEEQNAAEELMGCLKARSAGGGFEGAVCIADNIIGREDHNGGNGVGAQNELSYTPQTVGVPGVAFAFDGYNQTLSDTSQTIRSDKSDGDHVGMALIKQSVSSFAVRRLTPTECARLQGFPDDHCRIPWRGKPAEDCPDGPQYKAYGNSMAVPCMEFIGERIDNYLFGGFEI